SGISRTHKHSDITRKRMASPPEQRFQNADELIGVLEGGRSPSFTTDATMALPSMAGARRSPAPPPPPPPPARGARSARRLGPPRHGPDPAAHAARTPRHPRAPRPARRAAGRPGHD